MPESFKPKVFKVICQANYKPQIGFYNNYVSAAAALTSYPHWRTDRLSIILHDFTERCSLIIKHDSFSFEQDNPSNLLEKEKIKDALEKLPTALDINSFNRIGYRRKYILPLDMNYDNIINIFQLKFFPQKEELKSILPGNIINLHQILNFKDDSNNCNITIGPINKDEMINYMEFNKKLHLNPEFPEKDYLDHISSYPDYGVYFDVDMFHKGEKIDLQFINNFVEEARDRMTNLVDNLSNYIQGEKLKDRK